MEVRTARLKAGQKAALWATAVTLLISALKWVVGTHFDSKILVADAFHGAADTVAIFASAFGLWLASREMRILANLATDSGLNRPPIGAKRRWMIIICPCGRIESRISAFSSILP